MTLVGNIVSKISHRRDVSLNAQNLIEKVKPNGSTVANYWYLSDGMKLSATDAGGNGLYYWGSLVYRKQGENLRLESAGFSGGRFVVTATSSGTTYTPNYFVTDHLGSVRVVVDDSGRVLECNDYYPFGMRRNTGQISDNRYRYNGKEEQRFA